MENVVAPTLETSERWRSSIRFHSFLHIEASAADLSSRGVVLTNSARAEAQQAMALRFLAGYNCMLLADPIRALDASLAETEPEHKGFVVEGAAMGAAVRDSLSVRGGLLQTLLALHGTPFEYLIAVGAGWALARTPWRRDGILAALDPLLVPLACDGRGFHDLYFSPLKAETGKIRRYRGARASGYDAGLGRALWFIASGDVQRLEFLISRFEEKRRPDLLAGVGLAMAYAGPTTAGDWNALRAGHREDWKHVGQGVCFAAEAMRRAGVVPDHTEFACQEALNLSSKCASAIAASTRPSSVTRPFADEAYRSWRTQICDRLTSEAT